MFEVSLGTLNKEYIKDIPVIFEDVVQHKYCINFHHDEKENVEFLQETFKGNLLKVIIEPHVHLYNDLEHHLKAGNIIYEIHNLDKRNSFFEIQLLNDNKIEYIFPIIYEYARENQFVGFFTDLSSVNYKRNKGFLNQLFNKWIPTISLKQDSAFFWIEYDASGVAIFANGDTWSMSGVIDKLPINTKLLNMSE